MEREYQPVFEDMGFALSRFDTVIEWLLIGLLAFMPLAFGVVHAWSEEVVIALSGAIVIFFSLKLIFHCNQVLIWSWAYVPAGLFLLVAALQLISLPARLVSVISPNTAIVKAELLGDMPNADAVLGSMPLSFYPYATRHDLRLVLAVAGVFVAVLNVYRHPAQIKRLLTAIAVIGGVIALLTLAQNLFGNGKIYWFVSGMHSKGYSGPFVNHSNYGQFMNLSLGATLGLVIVKLHEAFSRKKITPSVVFEYLSSGPAKPLWLLVAVMGLGAATIFVSLTRGGMLSMLTAAAFTTLLLASRRSLKGHGWIIVIVALIAFICVLYVGFDAVYNRLATLRDFHEAQSGRLQILKDIVVAWAKFPVLGAGLGTHSVVYPMFDRSTITALAAHAENEYAQAVEETGLVGLGLLVIFGIIIWSSYVSIIRNSNLPICSAVYGLGFGILAILINSLSDFGQHLPANAILSAIFCALLLVLAQQAENCRPAAQIVTDFGKFKFLRMVAFLGVSGIWVWAFIDANNFRIAQAHWAKVGDIEKALTEKDWQGTDAEYADLISQAEKALEYQPDNIKYRHWLNVYRWCSISRMTYPDTPEAIISEDLMPAVRNVVAEFHKARAFCPTYGPTYSVVGQIEKFILNDESGAERIRKGFRLAPCDPISCFVAGYLDFLEGKSEDCVEKFERATQLDGRLFAKVANIYVNHLSRPDLAVLAAGDDISRLTCVADALEDMQYSDLAEQTREKIKHLFEVECSGPDASASAFISLANIYREQQDYETAIEYYRRALALDYAQVHWRLELARLLAKAERLPEAMHEAKICLQLQPQLEAAERLVADFSVHPDVFDQESKSP